jgi:hypothetical protein
MKLCSGMTWMEWMNMRTDEDIQREEQAEAEALASFHLYSGDYYEEDETAEAANGTGDSSPAWVPAPGTTGTTGTSSASRVHADTSGHNFKSADAHAPPALHHNSHHLSPESPTSPNVTRHAHSHGQTHSAHSAHHHSSRQEDGHTGSEGAARAVSLEELSVPSCSDEDEEYDFDDF